MPPTQPWLASVADVARMARSHRSSPWEGAMPPTQPWLSPAAEVARMARSHSRRGDYGRSALRWRAASYRNTPAATETFRLLTVPAIGMAAR